MKEYLAGAGLLVLLAMMLITTGCLKEESKSSGVQNKGIAVKVKASKF